MELQRKTYADRSNPHTLESPISPSADSSQKETYISCCKNRTNIVKIEGKPCSNIKKCFGYLKI